MDRLVCGDVGFGKTEVALRAAFAAAMDGKQVAVIVPTTLLARQHFRTFAERFKGLPLNVAQASRFVAAGDLKKVKEGLADGSIDIVVGTHALLGKAIRFKDLGLIIVDEEQHFGVSHKERLKELRAEVHVLTLTATPIPRTLQLALTGVRELSIIATPPVDRLAVRTFVMPFDPLSIREALLRERYRGGQAFYVVPRVEDIAEVKILPRQGGAGGEGRGRARADGRRPARGCHDGVLRGQVRHPAVDDHRRVRPRHPDRQHAHRAPRRHVRPRPALPAARPRRALEDARLCAVHGAGEPQPHGPGGAAAEGAAIARYARRRVPACLARPRHPRRRQPPRRGAVRSHQGGRLRALPADAGRGRRGLEGGCRRARRGAMVADHRDRRARHDPGVLRRRPAAAARIVPASRHPRDGRRDRCLRGRADRPLRTAAGRGRAASQDHGHQGAVPARQRREGRGRTEGHHRVLPRQFLRRSGRARSPTSASRAPSRRSGRT